MSKDNGSFKDVIEITKEGIKIVFSVHDPEKDIEVHPTFFLKIDTEGHDISLTKENLDHLPSDIVDHIDSMVKKYMNDLILPVTILKCLVRGQFATMMKLSLRDMIADNTKGTILDELEEDDEADPVFREPSAHTDN